MGISNWVKECAGKLYLILSLFASICFVAMVTSILAGEFMAVTEGPLTSLTVALPARFPMRLSAVN